MMNIKTLGYVMAFAAVIIWAGNFVVARAIAASIPPIQMNFWRWVVAFVCILPFALRSWRHDWPIMKNHLPYLAAYGLVSVTLLNSFVYAAGATSSSINIVLFVPSAPIIIMLLSRIFCGEAITWRRFAGLCIIITGICLLVSRGNIDNLLQMRISIGDIFSIAGVICFGIFSFITRYRPQHISVTSFLAITFGFGILLILPALFWEMYTYPPTVWEGSVLFGIVYAGIGCSSVAYLFWTKAIDAIGPVAAGMIYYSIPLFTALEGVLILGEDVTLVHILGGALMLSGMAITTIPKKITAP